MKQIQNNNNRTADDNRGGCRAVAMAGLLSTALLTTAAISEPVQAAADSRLQAGQEYMLVTNYPNNLHVLDLATEQVMKTCNLPDDFGPGAVRVSPDRTTAFVLNNHYEDLYGIDLDSCEVVFTARQSGQDERVKSIFSFALSPDGQELYTVQNPTRLHRDRYEVLEPRLAVYRTDAGLDAKPVRSFPAPRQISVMSVTEDGTLLMAGEDFYAFNVRTGEMRVALPNRNWKRPLYAAPDVLNAWPLDTPSGEFLSLYTTARFQDEQMDLNSADWIYGFHTIDLKTGKAQSIDFGPITEIYFTGIRNPVDKNVIYGVLNRLAKYDIEKQQLVKAVALDHSYYCVAVNDSGTRVYLAGTYNDVAIFDADSLEKTGSIKLPGGDMAITTAQVFRR